MPYEVHLKPRVAGNPVLFASHTRKDGAAARDVQAQLEGQGHRSLFLDLDLEKGILAGASWERTLYAKLRACRAVIDSCTDHYLDSKWCFAEMTLARAEGKEIFALLMDPLSSKAKLPSILKEGQYIDMRGDREGGYRRLWQGLKGKGIVPGEHREWSPADPPYPGLRAFEQKDAPVFFGRDKEIREGVELLNRARLQGHPRLVQGASGSGKSSLFRAGIVPQLRREKSRWLEVDPFRPRRDPAREAGVRDECGVQAEWKGEVLGRYLVGAGASGQPGLTGRRQRTLRRFSAIEHASETSVRPEARQPAPGDA